MIKLVTTSLISFLCCSSHADVKAKIVSQIRTEAKAVGIDPDLAVAIATVESGLDPDAIGELGEIGLFQLRPEFHNVRHGHMRENIRVAVLYLRRLKDRASSKHGSAWFVLFNYGPNSKCQDLSTTDYYKRVMRELARIKINNEEVITWMKKDLLVNAGLRGMGLKVTKGTK